jgi:hypothetical protein
MNYLNQKKQLLNIELRPSRYFFTLISGMHLIVIFLICMASVPWYMSLLLLIILTLSYIFLIKKYVYRKSKYIVIKLWQYQDISNHNKWKLQFADKKIKDAELKAKGYVSDYLIIMYFKIETESKIFSKLKYKNIPVVVFPDMLDYSYYIGLKRFLLGY